MIDNIADGKLPLGLCRQAIMKLDSAMNDVNEIQEDPDLTPEQKATFETLSETIGRIAATIVNVVSQECDEDDFMKEEIEMDHIDEYPGTSVDDIMNSSIG